MVLGQSLNIEGCPSCVASMFILCPVVDGETWEVKGNCAANALDWEVRSGF